MAHAQHSSFRPMAEVPFRPARQLSEYKGKGASASREQFGHGYFLEYPIGMLLAEGISLQCM